MKRRNHTRDFLKERLIVRARARGRKKGLPATIQKADLVWPKTCPVLGIDLNYDFSGGDMARYPTLDRFKPELGYVAGNVFVISHRANTLKNNGTLEEFKKIVRYLRHRPVHSDNKIYRERQHHCGPWNKTADTKARREIAFLVLRESGRTMDTAELAREITARGTQIDLSDGTSGFVQLLLRDGRFTPSDRASRRESYRWSLRVDLPTSH